MIIRTDNDPRYFIFSAVAEWSLPGSFDTAKLAHFVMHKTRPSKGDMEIYAEAWWREAVLEQKDKTGKRLLDMQPVLRHLSAKFYEEESWCLNLFNHWTFDQGQTDTEFRAQFLRYVERQYNNPRKRALLMGADNFSKWSNVCRCESCQQKGIVYIDHA